MPGLVHEVVLLLSVQEVEVVLLLYPPGVQEVELLLSVQEVVLYPPGVLEVMLSCEWPEWVLSASVLSAEA